MKVNLKKVNEDMTHFFNLQARMIEDDNVDFFLDFKNLLVKYQPTDSFERFRIGEVFNEYDPRFANQAHGGDFRDLVKRVKNKYITIDPKKVSPLKRFRLEKTDKLWDTELKEKIDYTPLKEERYWLIFYLMVIQPTLGEMYLPFTLKKENHYLFHIQPDEIVNSFVGLWWNSEKWLFYGYSGDGMQIFKNTYFVY
jgi:hypothetical protein